MKYMTPELLAQYQSEDADTALQAYEQWEQAGERYQGELSELRRQLPESAVELMDRFRLHDARVLWAGIGDGALAIVLMLDGDEGGLQIDYDLAAPAAVVPHTEIAEDCPVEWLYDEWGLTDGGAFVHSILFTDGAELRLVFRGLRWRHFPRSMFVGVPNPHSLAAHKLAELVAA